MFSRIRHIPALALTCMLADPLAAADTAPASQPGVTQLQRQIKQFNKQIKRLKRQVAWIAAQSGATGPRARWDRTAPRALPVPQGEPRAKGAGGEPVPAGPAGAIAPGSTGTLEVAGDAIVQDTSPLAMALGGYTSKIGLGAIGR